MTRKSHQTHKGKGKGAASTSAVPPSQQPVPIVHPSALVDADGEDFDFTNLNVSDDESDDDNDPARQSGHSNQQAHSKDSTKLGVNDPSLPAPSSRGAADVHHFFEKFEGKNICKLCR
jgi:hypothetical protein